MSDATLEIDDHVLVLDGDVVELFVRGVGGGTRIHLRHLSVHNQGEDRKGRTRIHFAPGPEPQNGFRIEVPPERQADFDAFVEKLRAARQAATGAG